MADDERRAQIEAREHLPDIVGHGGNRHSIGSRSGLAVTAQVDGDEPVPVGEVPELVRPDGGGKAGAVEQDDRRSTPPLDDMNPSTVTDLEEVVNNVGRQLQFVFSWSQRERQSSASVRRPVVRAPAEPTSGCVPGHTDECGRRGPDKGPPPRHHRRDR